MVKRSLFMCSHAKVDGTIYCEQSHSLNLLTDEGTIDIERLARGSPLELGICQSCYLDYDEMGGPVAKEDRGWLRVTKPD